MCRIKEEEERILKNGNSKSKRDVGKSGRSNGSVTVPTTSSQVQSALCTDCGMY